MKKVTILAICLMFVSGCGGINNQKIEETTKDKTFFEIDENTISKSEEQQYKISETNQEQQKEQQEQKEQQNEQPTMYDTLGELTIQEDESTDDFEITNDKSIVYKGVTYNLLQENINNIQTKYTSNTLINFIIHNYEPDSNLIYTNLIKTEQQVINESQDVEEFTLDDELSSSQDYVNLREKYGEPVTWCLSLTDSETRDEQRIYGSRTYVMITGAKGGVVLP